MPLEDLANVPEPGTVCAEYSDPLRAKLQEIIDDTESERSAKLVKAEKLLDGFYELLPVESLYICFLDAFLWTSWLAASLKEHNECVLISMMNRSIIMQFHKHVKKLSRTQLVEAVRPMEADSRLTEFFKAMLPSKWTELFKEIFVTKLIAQRMVQFLDTVVESENLLDVLRWAFETKLIRFCNAPRLITLAVLTNRHSTIMNYAQRFPQPVVLERMIRFLDSVVALRMSRHDPYADTVAPTPANQSVASSLSIIKDNQLLSIIFTFRIRFNMDMDCVKSAVFVRKMHSLMRTVHDSNDGLIGDNREFFKQKLSHLMRDDERMQYAVLSYLSRQSIADAVFFAVYMDVEQKMWPHRLHKEFATAPQRFADTRDLVDKIKRDLKEEYERNASPEGTLIFSGHRVFVIDSPSKVQDIFIPFLEDEQHKYFGLDAEWDQSYCGEIGILGLIQISARKQTCLLDIVSLQKFYQKDDWIKFFSLMFTMEKTIFGFALDSDLQVLLHAFPYLAETELVKSKNVICLHNTVNAIKGEPELFAAVFNKCPPEKLNLAGLAKYFLDYDLSKGEQASVWSERPLRTDQIKYAAIDSLACWLLYNSLHRKVGDQQRYASKIDKFFFPLTWPRLKSREAEPEEGEAAAVVSKKVTRGTKCTDYTNEELVELIKEANKMLERSGRELVDPSSRSYVSDTMCTQFGHLLRRCGVSVIDGQTPSRIMEMGLENDQIRILTCGKAKKKYPFGSRVIDVPASTLNVTLDKLLMGFLNHECLGINPETIEPRCMKCNGRSMARLPTSVMRYLHMSAVFGDQAVAEDGDQAVNRHGYTVEDLMAAREGLPKGYIQAFINYGILITDAALGHLCVTPNCIIDFNRLAIYKANLGKLEPGTKAHKMALATHKNFIGDDYKPVENLYHAVCCDCGKENVGSEVSGNLNKKIRV